LRRRAIGGIWIANSILVFTLSANLQIRKRAIIVVAKKAIWLIG